MRAKENIKTIILILLIISSCLLALKIWAFDSGMISSTSYLFRLVEWADIGLKYGFNTGQYINAQEEQIFENSIFYPNQIIINKETQHYFSYFDVKKLDTINQDIREIIKNALSENQKNWIDSDVKEFKSAIIKDSVLVKYSAEFSYDIFSEYIGVLPSQFGQEISFDNVLISFDLKNNKLNIYYKNTSQAVKKFQTDLSQKNQELILKILDQNELFDLCTFGFENKTNSKVSVGDFIVFLQADVITNEVEQINPLSEEINTDGSQKLLENLLKTFDFNISFSKAYDDAEGSKVYVENNVSIKISQDGFIEYTVSNPQRGLKIDSAGTSGYFNRIKLLNITTKLLSKIGSNTIGGSAATVRYAGMEQNGQDKTIRVYYDYIIDGIPLSCKTGGIKGYPITIDVNESGQISYAKIYANTYKYTNNKINNLSYNDVSDVLIINSLNSIESLELSYEKSPFSNKVVTKWNFIS